LRISSTVGRMEKSKTSDWRQAMSKTRSKVKEPPPPSLDWTLQVSGLSNWTIGVPPLASSTLFCGLKRATTVAPVASWLAWGCDC
ncbi:hypothetical protein KCV00_g281, partial [Aureobasidium melanogenum]